MIKIFNNRIADIICNLMIQDRDDAAENHKFGK